MNDLRNPHSERMRLRVAVLDDHPVVLNGLAVRLSSELNIDVVGLFTRSKDLLRCLEHTSPDVIVLDIELDRSDLDGKALIRGLRRNYPGSAILAFSAHNTPETLLSIQRAGAHAFVDKGQAMTELVNVIHALGNRSCDARKDPETLRAAFDVLSPREKAVISCYLRGMTVSQIAEKLQRSRKTVSTQKMASFRKLGVANDQELFDLERHVRPST